MKPDKKNENKQYTLKDLEEIFGDVILKMKVNEGGYDFIFHGVSDKGAVLTINILY